MRLEKIHHLLIEIVSAVIFAVVACKAGADDYEGSYTGYPNIGMVKDSFLIKNGVAVGGTSERIDICYYVGFNGIEFYSLDTGGRNLWIENRGESPLFIFQRESIKLAPKERIHFFFPRDVPQS